MRAHPTQEVLRTLWARVLVAPGVQEVQEVQKRGAGEIVLNMMNQDGVRNGYDLVQLKKVRDVCKVPLIASGGAGTMQHFLDAFEQANVDGALAASVFHKQIINIGELKSFLKEKEVEIRAC